MQRRRAPFGPPIVTTGSRRSTIRRNLLAPLAIAVAVAIATSLTGCAGIIENPIQGAIEGATGGTVDLGGTEIPDGFPTSEVPLYDGDIVAGVAAGNADGKIYNISVAIPDATALAQITTQLEGAGFTTDASLAASGKDGGTAVFSTTSWNVLVVTSRDNDGGWTANYTVTSL